MSKYIDEIIKDIKQNPTTWKRFDDWGLKKDNIIIAQCGNGSKFFMFWATSIAKVIINNKDTTSSITFCDRYKIEEVFLWWMKNIKLEILLKD